MILRGAGKPVEAKAALERAVDLQQKLRRDNPGATDIQFQLAQSYFSIGKVCDDVSNIPGAKVAFEETRTIAQKLLESQPENLDFLDLLAGCHNDIGYCIKKLGGDFAAAMDSFKDGLAIRQRLIKAKPSISEFQLNYGVVLVNFAHQLREMGRPNEALVELQRGQDVFQKLVTDNPSVLIYQQRLAWSLDQIGWTLSKMEKLPAAIEYFKQEETALRQLAKFGRKPPSTRIIWRIA